MQGRPASLNPEQTDPVRGFSFITKPSVMQQAIASLLLKREFFCCGSDRSGAEGDARKVLVIATEAEWPTSAVHSKNQ